MLNLLHHIECRIQHSWIFVFLLLFATTISAKQASEITFSIGASAYKGDVGGQQLSQSPSIAGGFFYKRWLGTGLKLRTGVTGALVAATDGINENAFYQTRNASFNGRYFAPEVGLEYYFRPFREKKTRERVSLYTFAGAGVMVAQAAFGASDISNSNFKVLPAIPFGLGLKYKVSQFWDFGIEYHVTRPFSDFGDSFEQFSASRFAQHNPHSRDLFMQLSLQFSYNFYSIKCPVIYQN